MLFPRTVLPHPPTPLEWFITNGLTWKGPISHLDGNIFDLGSLGSISCVWINVILQLTKSNLKRWGKGTVFTLLFKTWVRWGEKSVSCRRSSWSFMADWGFEPGTEFTWGQRKCEWAPSAFMWSAFSDIPDGTEVFEFLKSFLKITLVHAVAEIWVFLKHKNTQNYTNTNLACNGGNPDKLSWDWPILPVILNYYPL